MKLTVESVISFTLIAMMISVVYAQPLPTLLWYHGIPSEDIAVSKDGQYVANVDGAGKTLRFYSREGDGTPLWTWSAATESLMSVAISEQGDYLVVGSNLRVHYWIDAKNRGSSPNKNPTWQSAAYGLIDRRCLDISDDGEYVLAGSKGYGSQPTVLYWAGATSKSGSSISYTWGYQSGGGFDAVDAVDLSSNGDYALVGTGSCVAYWKDARSLTGSPVYNWRSTEAGDINDVAVSDDGDYAAASAMLASGGVYYWAGATGLSGNPATRWRAKFSPTVEFLSVDISSDGDSVIAGDETDNKVYFWGGARALTGKPQNPSWTYPATADVNDVAINQAGDYMAAGDGNGKLYFFDRTGDKKWDYTLDQNVVSISISSDGKTLVVGTPGSSTYLFDTGFPTPRPVGGMLTPVNKLTILAPYLALLGLVGVVTVAVVTKRRRKP